MLDLCKPLTGVPQWLQWTFLLLGVLSLIGIKTEIFWIFGISVILLLVILLYGLIQQALRLIRGESVSRFFTGKPISLDERQVRNDLIAVDITWMLILFVIIAVGFAESKGWIPHGLWPLLILGIGLIVRFTMRWLLDRYA
jgi:hypothetical protein